MHKKHVLGVDLGTSSLKIIVVDQDGDVSLSESESYPLNMPQVGYSEQNPHAWFDAFDTCMSRLLERAPTLKDSIEGLSISGQMHSLVLLDKENAVLRDAILWNDVRTTQECREIEKTLGSELLAITRNRALEGFTLPKILWVRKHEPELFNRVQTFLLPKDYLRFRLTGHLNMDFSDAAGTLLLDVEKKVWSERILNAFKLPTSICPSLIESTDEAGVLSQMMTERYGFTQPIHIFGGGADNACAAVGAGINTAGVALCSVGTSGVFLTYEAQGSKDFGGDLHFFNHADGHYYAMGVTLSAGSSLNWFKSVVAPDASFEALLADIDTIPIGSEGLLFTPYLSGERTPYPDGKIRGSFIGLDLSHTRSHMARAVIEGITFSLMDSKRMTDNQSDTPLKRIVSVGGGAKNQTQVQIQANVFNTPVLTLRVEQGPALGAAMIAAVGLKWFDSFEACTNVFVQYNEPVLPQADAVERYASYYALYRKVYASTAPLCHELLNI